MSVVYACFEDRSAAVAAEADTRATFGRGGAALVQLHTRAPLDANHLPEGATEFGRNIVLAMLGGGVFMAATGGIVGAFGWMLGLGVGLGIALGFVTGLLMGLVGAMQAGTRVPKPQLRALEPQLQAGATLLLVEVTDRAQALAVVEQLQRHAPAELDIVRRL